MCQSFDVAEERVTAAIDTLEADATMLELHHQDDSYVRAKIAGAMMVQAIYRRVFRGLKQEPEEGSDEAAWTIGKGSGAS